MVVIDYDERQELPHEGPRGERRKDESSSEPLTQQGVNLHR